MYTITKLILSHSKDMNATKCHFATVNCSQEDMLTRVIPRLKKLAEADNLNYRFVGSDVRNEYIIEEVKGIESSDLIDRIRTTTIFAVDNYNDLVRNHNMFIKRNNKKLYKPLEEGCKETVALTKYLPVLYKGIAKDTKVDGYIAREDTDND